MKRTTAIRPELREWILNTTRAGHSIDEVLRLLKETGYDPRESRSIVATVLKIPLSALQPTAKLSGKRPRHPEAPRANAGDREIHVRVSTDAPVVRVLDPLLDDDECDALIELARPRLARALTVDTAGKQQVDHRRTSEGMFFRLGETPLIERIEARLENLLGLPASHGEGLQVLHYGPGQEYEPHFDWFDPAQPGFEAVTAHGGQRVASVVMYLNTPDAGGGTGFPAVGLTVTALKGSAVYFAYETGDELSLHAGLPVLRGEKWIATKWLRERPFLRND
ncbi:2OG-Fe(II) oxygenase [Dyella sp.]|jgi:prolyl 4-hydroxylase|uniref:2OG-Fe(II) oxygenase n=1 Tax=Dyella sp. TaxID=1869338 RepID=UPI002D7973F7|nr:2OG-Fe(II) oxygenase [Dyella sp.]HET6430747.1 2OG-Fe(II) oxygenase [Dyella sp.]